MAAELTNSLTLNYSKAGIVENFGRFGLTVTVTGKNIICGTQNIGTSNETLPLGDISTDIGAVYIYNNSASNYVTVGADSTNQPIKVKPLSQYYSEWNGTSVNVKANTAACDIQFVIVQN